MSKLEKAKDLYLRGFCGEYIKRRTDISIQQLLKTLRSSGEVFTKQDIINYQIDYIRRKYTTDEIISAYKGMSERYPVIEKAQKGRHIECLGCGFGPYAVVFSTLLGDDVYKKLRAECWSQKQIASMESTYGVKNAFEASSGFLKDNPMYSEAVKEKRRQTMLAKYGVEHPNQNPEIKAKMLDKMRKTNLELYGVENAMQVSKIAYKSAEHRQTAMMAKYGAGNSVQVKDIRDRIFDTRRKNGTLNSSEGEDVLHEMLIDRFGADDVFRNVVVDSRYPYHVDFYIKSRDLFIELNGDKCHNDHWFDPTNERDLQILKSWQENRDRIEASGKKSRYTKYINTWTISDVNKRNSAKQANLNYIVFWDGSRKIKRNNVEFPRLRDARDWFAEGCPDSYGWRSENTY